MNPYRQYHHEDGPPDEESEAERERREIDEDRRADLAGDRMREEEADDAEAKP